MTQPPAVPAAPAPHVVRPMLEDFTLGRWPDRKPAGRLGLLLGSLAVGLLAGLVLPLHDLGIGTTLVLASGGACVFVACTHRRDPFTLTCAGLALVLTMMMTVRDAEWIAVLCALAATVLCVAGSARARSFGGILLAGLLWPVSAVHGLPWLGRTFRLAMVAIGIEPACGHRFSPAHHFSSFHFILRTHVRDHGQAHVAPELTLRAKPVGCVDSGDNECRSNGPQLGNGSQQTHSSMRQAFAQHGLLGLLSQRLELIELLVEPLRPLLKSRFGQLSQPLLPLFGLINPTAWRRNTASAVDRLDPGHRPLSVAGKCFVGTHQFLQFPRRLMAVVNRTQHPRPQ